MPIKNKWIESYLVKSSRNCKSNFDMYNPDCNCESAAVVISQDANEMMKLSPLGSNNLRKWSANINRGILTRTKTKHKGQTLMLNTV